MDQTLPQFWAQLPFVSRHVVGLAFIIQVVCAVYPFWIFYLLFIPSKLRELHFWRPITAAVSLQSRPGLDALFQLFGLWNSLSRLEERSFRRRSDLVYFLVVVDLFFCLVGPRFGCYGFLMGINNALTYTVAQEDPKAQASFFSLETKIAYLPLINCVVGLLLNGVQGIVQPALGIVAGHMYLYFHDILPAAGGPRLLKTPQLIKRYCEPPKPGSAEQQAFRGRGHRLGE